MKYMRPSQRREFIFDFADGKADIGALSQRVSIVYIKMLQSMIQRDPAKRMTWSEFFEDPVICSEPDIYR